MAESDLPPMAERRPARRSRALLSGVLVHEDGRTSFPCTIRDVSRSGARIIIPKGHLIPKIVYLIDVRARTAQQAQRAWVNDTQAGFKYLHTIDLTKPVDPALMFLKRILDGHAPR